MIEDEKILEKINSFPRWHYQIDLNGHLTPIVDNKKINRQAQRKQYFFDPLVKIFGGSLAGKRVLDLGCNAGYWSLQAVENGCDFVLGIDGRQMHIDQSNFVFEVYKIKSERYHFIKGNVFETDFTKYGPFDVVLCLGLMYHINKPIELMERISAVNTDLLVLDTAISTRHGSLFEVRHESLEKAINAVDYEMILWPTQQAVLDMAQLFGYEVRILKPRFNDYTGAKDYKKQRRRAFYCAKRTDLASVLTPQDCLPIKQTGGMAKITDRMAVWLQRRM